MEEVPPIIDNFSIIYDYDYSYKLYNEKYDYYSAAIDKIYKIKSIFEKFLKEKLETFKIKEEFKSQLQIDDNYMNLILLIKDEIMLNINGGLNVINEIIKYLITIKEKIKSNNKIYTDYLNFKNVYNAKLMEMENCKNKYYSTAEKAEKFTYEFLNQKIHNKDTEISDYEKKNKLQNNCKEDKEKYISKIKEVNDQIKTLNEKQEIIFNTNKDIEKKLYGNYLNILFSFYQFVSEGPESFEKKNKIKQNIIEITNKSEQIEELKYKEPSKIEFIQFKSKIDFNNCSDSLEMGIFLTVGEEMQNILGDYLDEDLEEYKYKTQLNAQLKQILNLDDKISENYEKEVMNIINTEIGQKIFINNLSQLRTNGKLQKSQKFIEFLGRVINKLIYYERDHDDNKYLKSCIILSQTFYYLNLNNEKKYISEYIKNNSWLNTPNFWRNFIENMLQVELSKVNNKKLNINDFLYTQLIPYIKNMKDFNIDDRIIIKIIDEFLIKYDYIKEEGYGKLFIFINNDLNEIEKMRKEYQDNPDLEAQLYPQDINKTNNTNKENK